MNKARTIEGRWKIFGKNSASLYGVLQFDPKTGLTLETKAPKGRSMEDLVRRATNRREVAPTILGHDAHNKPVTLFGCVGTNSDRSGGLERNSIHAMRALIGGHFGKWGDAKFNNAFCQLSLLSNWINRSPINRISIGGNPPRIGNEIPREIILNFNDGMSLKICETLSISSSRAEYCIKGDHYLEFAFPGGLAVDDILEKQIYPLGRLLTLFTGIRSHPVEIKFSDGTTPLPGIELLKQNNGADDAESEINGVRFPVKFSDLETRLGPVLQHWFKYYQDLDSVLNLFFTTIFNDGLYINHEFLLLAQAFEVYHGHQRHLPSTLTDPSRFKRRLARIRARAGRRDGEWLAEKLRYANQKSLAHKLEDLFKIHSGEVKQFIRNKHIFAQKIKNTRNYFTHFDERLRLKGKIATDTEMIAMVRNMRAFLKICIFKDLGLNGAPINEIIKGAKGWKIVSLNSRK